MRNVQVPTLGYRRKSAFPGKTSSEQRLPFFLPPRNREREASQRRWEVCVTAELCGVHVCARGEDASRASLAPRGLSLRLGLSGQLQDPAPATHTRAHTHSPPSVATQPWVACGRGRADQHRQAGFRGCCWVSALGAGLEVPGAPELTEVRWTRHLLRASQASACSGDPRTPGHQHLPRPSGLGENACSFVGFGFCFCFFFFKRPLKVF